MAAFSFRRDDRHARKHFKDCHLPRLDIEELIVREQERIFKEWLKEDPKAALKWWNMPQITKENLIAGGNDAQRKVQRDPVLESQVPASDGEVEVLLPVNGPGQTTFVQDLLLGEAECRQST